MIDRSYLPYQSAREYQDRKMAKWMGFFLSEHSTALSETGNTIDFSDKLPQEEKVILLNQVYLNKLKTIFTTIEGLVIGEITAINRDLIGIQGKEIYQFVKVSDILTLALAEELDD
ncbi:hypothetical protein [Streptococcus anginosus]|jgi:hypothetical protein|uniref:hypothetical protein n=1 Tax=Streptococcus anginosus TaxID=1328 RepID=UPI0022DFF73D|nr:hypothetical protein [Streptococcus anginosus]